MDLELLSSIVGNPVERLAYVGAHVDPETESGNKDPETTSLASHSSFYNVSLESNLSLT